MPEEMNAYEAERAARIEANKERMRVLGLAKGGALRVGGLGESEAEYLDAPGAGPEVGARPKPRKGGKASATSKRAREPALPARSSRRLRGIDVSGEPSSAPVRVVSYAEQDTSARNDKRRGLAFPDPSSFPGSEVAAPFTLRSIGVTVHALGAVHRGAFAGRYWSSPGCLFHHAYPVGYVATKHHFGDSWRMTIEAGEVGPVFRVTNARTGRTFAGPSPTKPWTAVCESIKTRTRISGPLFFGFSDPITMRAIAQTYTNAELAACVAGDALPNDVGVGDTTEARSDLEALVFELRARVDGLGEHAAIALARTTKLYRETTSDANDVERDPNEARGRRLASVAELLSVAKADGGARVRLFLETDELVSESARRWPAWRARRAAHHRVAARDRRRYGRYYCVFGRRNGAAKKGSFGFERREEEDDDDEKRDEQQSLRIGSRRRREDAEDAHFGRRERASSGCGDPRLIRGDFSRAGSSSVVRTTW